MRGQLSAEMLIVLVIVLGLAILLASTMMNSANTASKSIEGKTDNVVNYCTSDLDCAGGKTCDTSTNRCG